MISISKKIQESLKKKLYIARKKIELNNDIYLDSEHEKLCDYYKKYLELSKKFNLEKTTIKYDTIKIDTHVLSDNHEENDIVTFKDDVIDFQLMYNKYNKKFINRLYVNHDHDIYKKWIKEQIDFIKSLSPEEIYTLRCHTHDGDVIINQFIINNLKIDVDIDKLDNGYRKSKIVVDKNELKTNRDFILFYYQIKKYLFNKDKKKFSVLSKLELEEYIIKNYSTFDWNIILLIYIKDIDNIFKKCPVVKDNLVFYRGTNDDYYLKNSSKGRHTSKTLSSLTFDYKTAVSYANRSCCVMRIIAPEFSKVILIDILSPYEEKEVLLPFNTRFNIDYPRHMINYYKTNEICPDESKSKKILVSDLSIIPTIKSKSKSKS